MTLTVRDASVTGATTAGRILTTAEMDANWAHVIDPDNLFSVGGVVKLYLQAHQDTEYVTGDASEAGSIRIYSQLTTADTNDLVLVVGGNADVHIGRRPSGTGVLFIDMDIVVSTFANATRGHGLRILQEDLSHCIEFPTSGGIIEVTAALRGANGANDDLIFRSAGTAAIFKWANAANDANVMSLTNAGVLSTTGAAAFANAQAIPAGGTQDLGISLSSTASFGMYFGSGAPTLSAAKGSLYLRSDGTTTNNRAYINTDGGTTWTAITTVA